MFSFVTHLDHLSLHNGIAATVTATPGTRRRCGKFLTRELARAGVNELRKLYKPRLDEDEEIFPGLKRNANRLRSERNRSSCEIDLIHATLNGLIPSYCEYGTKRECGK